MRKQKDDERIRRAKSALKRIEQESEKILGATPTDIDEQNDPIDIWGKRIGHAIGYGLVMFLIWHLFTTYIIK